MRITQLRPNTDAFDEALRGYVRAERINDIVAAPTSKSYQDYFALVRAQAAGEPQLDHLDMYRHAPERLADIGRALRLYRYRDSIKVKGGVVYLDDEMHLAAAPHGVDEDVLVVQVHVRESLHSFIQAVARGVDNDMYRVSQAQMGICGTPHALQINYFADEKLGIEEFYDHMVRLDRKVSADMLAAMTAFAAAAHAAE